MFIGGSVGLTVIISLSNLFTPFRNLFNRKGSGWQFIHKLINCPMCLGMYIGAIMFGIQGTEVYGYLAAAGTTSLVAWIIYIKCV